MIYTIHITLQCHVHADAARYQNSYFGVHPFPSSVYFNCFGNESVLSSCQSPSTSCRSDDVAGVYCKGDIITGTIIAHTYCDKSTHRHNHNQYYMCIGQHLYV